MQACNGEGPHLMHNLEQGDYFGIMLPHWTLFWRAKTRQSKEWFSFIFVPQLIPAKSSSLEQPSSWEYTALWM